MKIITILCSLAIISITGYTQVDTSDHSKITKELNTIQNSSTDTVTHPQIPSKGISKRIFKEPSPEAVPERIKAKSVPEAEIIIDRPLEPNKKQENKVKTNEPNLNQAKEKTNVQQNKSE